MRYGLEPILKNETLATGLVRPKTTALFFDKLWVPDCLMRDSIYENSIEPFTVPKELCIRNPKCVEAYERAWAANECDWGCIAYFEKKYEFLRFESDLRCLLRLEEDEDSSPEDMQILLSLRKKYDSVITNFISDYKKKSIDILQYRDDHDDQPFVLTTFRNYALKEIAEIYNNEGIELVPIFLTPSEFDDIFIPSQGNLKENLPSLEICMDFIPIIHEAKLTWEQVLEIRKDKKARERLARLRRWFSLELAAMNENKIKGTISKRLDDYKWALKKHGIETLVGGFTSVASFISGPQLIALLSTSPLAMAGGGIAVGAGALVWITNKCIQKCEINRDEVAYIYEVNKLNNAIV